MSWVQVEEKIPASDLGMLFPLARGEKMLGVRAFDRKKGHARIYFGVFAKRQGAQLVLTRCITKLTERKIADAGIYEKATLGGALSDDRATLFSDDHLNSIQPNQITWDGFPF